MGITIADCLKLPALEGAQVVAGASGLGAQVLSCSVLEWSDVAAFKESYFGKNELIITSFFAAKDDVDTQCAIIKRLHELGLIGIIWYYVGILISEIDQRVIDTANSLGFPLIMMPVGQHLGYSEAINDILEAVFLSRTRKYQFTSTVLQRFSAFSDAQRNYKHLLRLLTEYTNCTLILCDSFLKPIAYWRRQGMETVNIERLMMNATKRDLLSVAEFWVSVSDDDQIYTLSMQQVTRKNASPMLLLFLNSRVGTDPYVMQQAAEVICTASEIWNLDGGVKSLLLRTIISNDVVEPSYMSSIVNMSMEKWSTFWYVRPDETAAKPLEWLQIQQLLTLVKTFLEDHKKTVLLDSFDESVVVLIKDDPFQEQIEELSQALDSFLQESKIKARMACLHIGSISQIQGMYLSIRKNWEYMLKIYPTRRLFNQFTIRLADQCRNIIARGQNRIDEELEILRPLDEGNEAQRQEMLNTLEVFLLDAECSTTETSNLLYVHNNTVKYRIKKAREKLGQSIFELPDVYYLYIALALRRIINTG